jgi:hypothetical protein
MKTVKEKNDVRDQEEWYDELFTDRGNQNGNKLRIYRHKLNIVKIKSISNHHREDILKENGFQFQRSFYYIQHKVYQPFLCKCVFDFYTRRKLFLA